MVISIKRHYLQISAANTTQTLGRSKHGEVAEYSLKPVQLFLAEKIIGQIMHALARIVPQSSQLIELKGFV